MKKTISVNIKGINFMIEEDAYELLQNYLDRLQNTLQNQEGSNEIIEDVELRIAEICSSKLSDSKQVIEKNDIEEILERLGDPSAYIDEDSEEKNYTSSEEQSYAKERRLFRDTDNATIAGVCSGIANFFSLDVVIIRAIFVVFFLFGGFGIPLYIILWVIIPKAKTSIDRLRMKGRPITVDNVRDEVENAAEKLKEGSKRFSARVRANEDQYKNSVSRGVRAIGSIVGIALIIGGVTILTLFMIFVVGGFQIFPVHSETGFLSFPEMGALVLPTDGDVTTAWTAALMIGFGSALFIMLLGTMFLMRIKNSWTKLSLLGLFLIVLTGGIMAGYLGMKTGRDFIVPAKIEREVGSIATEQLVINPRLNQLETLNDYDVLSDGEFGLMSINDETISFHDIRIKYKPSADSLFHIYQTLSAHSHSHERGLDRAKNIHHEIGITGDTVNMATDYSFPIEDKIRDQDVNITIEIPQNGTVKINNRVIRLGADEFDEDLIDPEYYERGKIKHDGRYKHYD